MKKITKLLVLSGLALSLLTGCTINGGGNGGEPEQPEVVKTLESISVSSQPTKTSYLQGESFDAAGLEVKAVYNTGEEVLEASAYTLSGFDSSTAGPKTVTVTYEGKTATFTVNVIGKNGLSIKAPTQTRYAVGDELSLTGLVVYQVYEDGTKVEIPATDYQVSGFSSAEAGPVTVTITAAGDTATFVVNVYALDWTAAEKSLMGKALIYDIPYFLGLEAYQNGHESAISTEEEPDYDFMWVEASSDYQDADEDDVNDYADMIEAIVVTDDEGQPVLDEGETIQAWNSYDLGQGRKYSDDVKKMGFDTTGPVYQYARWYNDNDNYYAYQVLTVGLSKDSRLLIASTIASVGYAGDFMAQPSYYYLAGETSQGEWDNWNNYYLPVMEEIQSFAYSSPSTVSFMDRVAFPEIVKYTEATGAGTLLLIAANSAVTAPYEHSYYYGDNVNDFELAFVNTSAEGIIAYTNEDVQAMFLAANYDASQITAEEDGSFTVDISDAGLEAYANYYVASSGYLWIDIHFGELDYERPLNLLGYVYDELAVGRYYVNSGGSLVCIDASATQRYPGGYFIMENATGSIAATTKFYTQLSLANVKADLLSAFREAQILGATETITWEDTYTKSTPDGTFKVGSADAEAITLTLDEENSSDEAVVLKFAVGDDAYVATYTVATKVMALTKNGADYKTFAATEGNTYATTWSVGEGDELVELVISAEVTDVFVSSEATVVYYCEDAGELVNIGISIESYNASILMVSFYALDGFYYPTEALALVLAQFVELGEGETMDAVVGIPSMCDVGITALSIDTDKLPTEGKITIEATYAASLYSAIKTNYSAFLTGLTPNEVDGLGTLYVSANGHYGLMFSFNDETQTVTVDYFVAPAVAAILNPASLA